MEQKHSTSDFNPRSLSDPQLIRALHLDDGMALVEVLHRHITPTYEFAVARETERVGESIYARQLALKLVNIVFEEFWNLRFTHPITTNILAHLKSRILHHSAALSNSQSNTTTASE